MKLTRQIPLHALYFRQAALGESKFHPSGDLRAHRALLAFSELFCGFVGVQRSIYHLDHDVAKNSLQGYVVSINDALCKFPVIGVDVQADRSAEIRSQTTRLPGEIPRRRPMPMVWECLREGDYLNWEAILASILKLNDISSDQRREPTQFGDSIEPLAGAAARSTSIRTLTRPESMLPGIIARISISCSASESRT